MTIWLFKFVHSAAIAIWIGGLIALPFLLVQRRDLDGTALDRLHRLTRFLHVALVSSGAFIAIGTGVALIFLRETFAGWFTLKLVLVAILVVMHIATGMAVIRTFEKEGRSGRLAALLSVSGTVAISAGILWLVLAKPEVEFFKRDSAFFQPGALARMLGPTVAPVIDAVTP